MTLKGQELPCVRGENHWTKRTPWRLPRGEKHHAAKLSEDEVRCIRHMHPAMSMTNLAGAYGVNRETISRIVHRKTWVHI